MQKPHFWIPEKSHLLFWKLETTQRGMESCELFQYEWSENLVITEKRRRWWLIKSKQGIKESRGKLLRPNTRVPSSVSGGVKLITEETSSPYVSFASLSGFDAGTRRSRDSLENWGSIDLPLRLGFIHGFGLSYWRSNNLDIGVFFPFIWFIFLWYGSEITWVEKKNVAESTDFIFVNISTTGWIRYFNITWKKKKCNTGNWKKKWW